jgi:hypothetical protein
MLYNNLLTIKMIEKKNYEISANILLNRLLEISVILDMFSYTGKKSILSKRNLKILQESLWETTQEWKMGNEKCLKMIEKWKKEKEKQLKELEESYTNEKKRIAAEYEQLLRIPGVKRISRKKKDDRHEELLKEKKEMEAVILEEFSLKEEQMRKNIKKYEIALLNAIRETEHALYEIDQLFDYLYKGKQKNKEVTYRFSQKKKVKVPSSDQA